LLLVVLGPPLFKTTEGVVVGFQIFAWAPKKNNKNSEKKIKFATVKLSILASLPC
jgi:hypothetical protein